MARLLHWTRNVLIALVALVALGAGTIWAMSERILRRQWRLPAVEIVVPGTPEAVANGRHFATTRGCTDCHGDRLQGGAFFDEPGIARLVAPNLAQLAREMSPAELERSIRHGVRRDGTTVRGMPSDSFYATTDADLGDLIAYLRSVEPASDALPETEVRYMGRLGLATGKYRLAPQILATSPRRRETLSPGDAISFGRYIAYTTCVECHGEKLMGDPRSIEPSPSLAIVASYEPAEFARLMKDGITATGKSPKLMGGVARARFAHLTTEEVDALYQYLSLLADPSAADRL